MPGAGSATLAWTPETSYLGGIESTPTYYNPGTNVQTQTTEVNRNLLPMLFPGEVEASDFLAQQFDGQFGVSFVLHNDDFHRLVFNDANTGFTSGTANSAVWYLGVDHLNGTVERELQGWVPQTCDITYSGTTEAVRITMSGPYGDEKENTSITPGTIENMNTGTEVPGHGAALNIGGSRVTKLQSATISLTEITRLIRDSNDPRPVEAVAGALSQSIDMTAVYDGNELYERALGSSGAASLEDFVDSSTASLVLDRDGQTIADYEFGTVKPNTYNWQDLVNNDADLNESVTFNATDITASDPTA
jgi:hypothetical protein